MHREICGRSPPEIYRVFGPLKIQFFSDKTVQRRGWTAHVSVYNCNYPHLEDNLATNTPVNKKVISTTGTTAPENITTVVRQQCISGITLT